MLKDMKASRERQASGIPSASHSDDDADVDRHLSRKQKAAMRRELQDLHSSGDEEFDRDESGDEGVRSLASDEEAEGGDEAPLEDIVAMQVRSVDAALLCCAVGSMHSILQQL